MSEFTHTDHCGSTSLIDLVFTLTPSQVLGCTTIPPLDNPNAKSYHLGILLTISWKSPVPQRNHPLKRRVWRYNHADFDRANELLCDLNPNDIFHTNIQTSWLQFKCAFLDVMANIQTSWLVTLIRKCAFLDVMAQCIPRSVVTTRKNLPWLSKSIIQLIRKRDRYFKKEIGAVFFDLQKAFDSVPHQCLIEKLRQTGLTEHIISWILKFKQLRNKVVYELRHAKQSFFSNLHPKNPREFWKVVRHDKGKGNSWPRRFYNNTDGATLLPLS